MHTFRTILIWLGIAFLSAPVYAKSVIFMIGDGMGYNHIDCVNAQESLFMSSLRPHFVRTSSADNIVTDSAASATAYACGIKTNNEYLGMAPDGEICETLAEKALVRGVEVYIATTDNKYGATPSAFYVHTDSRHNKSDIDKYRDMVEKKMHLSFDVPSVYEVVQDVLRQIDEDPTKDYFIVVEGAKIDKASHENDRHWMVQELIDFDKAVRLVWQYAEKHNVAVVVTADHETGNLQDNTCQFGSHQHSNANVPLYTKGLYKKVPDVVDNTEIYKIIDYTLY